MRMVKTEFENGDYARWIKEFQQRNPDSISFSNRIDSLNRGQIQIESLNPLKIRSKDITPKDYENLGLLTDYFNYLKEAYNVEDPESLVISVEGKLYTLMEDIKCMGEDTVIIVIDTDDNAEVSPIFKI